MLSVQSIARVVVNVIRNLGAVTGFDTGLLLLKDSNYAPDRRLVVVYNWSEALVYLTTWNFTSSSAQYKSVQAYFAAKPTPPKLFLSCYPSSETLADALSEVLNINAGFYGIAVGQTETDARIKALVAAVELMDQPFMVFTAVTGTASSVVASGSLLYDLHGLSSKRAVCIYDASNVQAGAALMGTAMGLAYAHKESAFALCYKKLSEIAPSELTETQVANIKNLGGNVYITRGYTHNIIEQGTVTNGTRYDEVMYVDMISSELQNKAVALLAENPDKMPQTDDSTTVFMNAFASILNKFTEMGVLASGKWRGGNVGPLTNGEIVENGYIMWADSYDNQSDADRAAHKAVPISIGLVMAGSIESIVIYVNVVL